MLVSLFILIIYQGISLGACSYRSLLVYHHLQTPSTSKSSPARLPSASGKPEFSAYHSPTHQQCEVVSELLHVSEPSQPLWPASTSSPSKITLRQRSRRSKKLKSNQPWARYLRLWRTTTNFSLTDCENPSLIVPQLWGRWTNPHKISIGP